MGIENTTDESFHEDTSTGLCVVDFWATWCGPCKSFAPVFERSSQENPDVRHLKMDVDMNPSTAGGLGIMSIPTLLFIKDGEIIGSSVGAMSERQLAETLQKMRDI
jgi:thioredoxin 1